MDGVQVAPRGNRLTSWVPDALGFLRGVRAELEKVTWPTRAELVKATRMIVVLSLALGFAIGMLDLLLQFLLVNFVARIAR
jgi:preprotein translocase subunit SecE